MKKLAKFLASLAVIAASAVAIYLCIRKFQERIEMKKKELDAFLMGEEAKDIEIYATGEIENHLVHDLDFWDPLKVDEMVSISFYVPAQESSSFLEQAAALGCSSSLDQANHIADVEVKGPMSTEQIHELASALDQLAKNTQAVYEGFTFE